MNGSTSRHELKQYNKSVYHSCVCSWFSSLIAECIVIILCFVWDKSVSDYTWTQNRLHVPVAQEGIWVFSLSPFVLNHCQNTSVPQPGYISPWSQQLFPGRKLAYPSYHKMVLYWALHILRHAVNGLVLMSSRMLLRNGQSLSRSLVCVMSWKLWNQDRIISIMV